jgi:hypothetical protein
VKDDFTLPPGWSYFLSYTAGKVYKITFVTEGLKPGESAVLTMNSVRAPKEIGKYEWSWKAVSSAEEVYEGTVTTFASYGKLAKFAIADVPDKIRVKETFEVTIIAYDEFGNIKEDYVAEVEISSTDKEAIFPKTYQFKEEDKGKAKIEITYMTKGDQYFTITDKEAKVSTTSPKTLVLPAVPINLVININEGAFYAYSPSVVLTLSAENAEECKYSNDGVLWTPYENFTEERCWELISGEGTRIVYFQCRNKDGESEIVYDSIELVAPLIPQLPAIPTKILSYAAVVLSIIAIALSLRRKKGRRREES